MDGSPGRGDSIMTLHLAVKMGALTYMAETEKCPPIAGYSEIV